MRPMKLRRTACVATAALLLAACDSGPVTIRAASSHDDDNLSDGAGSINGTVAIPSDGTYLYTYSIGGCDANHPCAMALVGAAGKAVVLPAQHYGSTLAPWPGGGVAHYGDVTGTAYITVGNWTGEAGFIVTIKLSCDGREIALTDGSGDLFCPDGAGWSLTLAAT
jgi:hypothetical protein